MTYNEYFIDNFYLNFFVSLFFVIYLFIKSALVHELIVIKKINIFGEFSKIIIIFLQLSFYTALFNILFIFKATHLIKYLFFISLLSALFLFYCVFRKRKLDHIKLKLKNLIKKKYTFSLGATFFIFNFNFTSIRC